VFGVGFGSCWEGVGKGKEIRSDICRREGLGGRFLNVCVLSDMRHVELESV